MATLADQFTYSQNATFQNKVRQALVSAAIAISGEAQANNRNRTTLAIAVLANPTAYLQQFCEAVTADPTVSGKIAGGGASGTETDADVSNAVSASWNAFANR
jgi:hypothetical protein